MTAKKPGDAIMSNNEDDDDDDESLISSEESSSSSSSSEDYSTDSDTKRFRQLWDERRKHQRLLRFLQVRHPQVLAEYQKLFDEEKKVGKHNQGKCVSKGWVIFWGLSTKQPDRSRYTTEHSHVVSNIKESTMNILLSATQTFGIVHQKTKIW